MAAATAVCALGAAASASAATDVQQAQSENWSGYVAGAGAQATKFKSVSGSWVVPSANCTSASQPTYSAFWVGLGGAGNTQALEQTGTESNCTASGAASYYAWYELVPKAPVRIDLPVAAGDHISSRVTVDGTSVAIRLTDETSGQTFSKTLTMSNPDVSSAEWIAEAPSQCDGSVSNCTPLPLTNFGTTQFTSTSATGADGHTGPISDPEWAATAVTLSPDASSMGLDNAGFSSAGNSGGATPSALSSDGSSFSVSYASDASAQSIGSGSGGYGYGDGSGGYGYGYGGGGYYVIPGVSSSGGGYYVIPGISSSGGGTWIVIG